MRSTLDHSICRCYKLGGHNLQVNNSETELKSESLLGSEMGLRSSRMWQMPKDPRLGQLFPCCIFEP